MQRKKTVYFVKSKFIKYPKQAGKENNLSADAAELSIHLLLHPSFWVYLCMIIIL
jgi:hypothetical protein